MRVDEISCLRDTPNLLRQPPLLPHRQLQHLRLRPNVKLSLGPLAVRILCRAQPSSIHSQIPPQISIDPSHHLPDPLLARGHPQLRIPTHQLPIVI